MITGVRRGFGVVHWPLIGVVSAIITLGSYNLHSAAAAREPTLYMTQLIWFACGLVLMGLVAVPDYRMSETLAYIIYVIVCLLLVAVLFEGKTVGGAQRWLVIGPIRFQPSELAKFSTILCLARFFAHRPQQGGYTIGRLLRPFNPSRPLAAAVALGVFWENPGLVDPLGQFARYLLTKPMPVLEELLWFRFTLIGALIAFAVLSVLIFRLLAQRSALLNPWPPGRMHRLFFATGLLCCVGAVGIVVIWYHPFVSDPVGYSLLALRTGANPGGVYATLTSNVALRIFLVGIVFAYGAVSLLRVRQSSWSVGTWIAPLDLLMLPVILVLVEPDLGTAGVVFLIGLTMVLVIGVQPQSMLLMGVLGAIGGAVSWFAILQDYQRRRILTFIDPENDIKGAGWNVVQSMIAVGSGRWWGKGHLGGTQSQLSFLPEQHTDFAFSVWAEEQGFMGCLLVLTLYGLLLAFAIGIAMHARDTFGSLVATGIAALIFWHTAINIAMVIGMMPVVGLTLPLFSYGGTSVLTMMLGVGMLLSIERQHRTH